MSKPNLVFVYGTLKRGYGNNYRCLANSKFLGVAVSVAPHYRLYEGGVPFLTEIDKEEEGGFRVKGELYEVSAGDFSRCDKLEGHPHAYRREEQEFAFVGGEADSVMAWVYLWPSRERGMREVQPVKGVVEWQPRCDPQR